MNEFSGGCGASGARLGVMTAGVHPVGPGRNSHASVGLPPRLDVGPAGGFVGRQAELTRLLASLDQAASGLRVVLVAGEPGAGKTTLAAELARHADARGAAVTYGRCDEGVAIPYQPWREAARFLADRWGDRVRSAVERNPELVERVLPAIGTTAREDRDDLASRAELLDGVVDVITAAGDPGEGVPTVLVLDDLHWADQGTVLLVRHVLSSAASSALLVIATYRPTDVAPDSPTADLLGTLAREPTAIRVDLAGLESDDVELLIARRVGRALDEGQRAWAQRLWRDTGGNPFFATAVLDGIEDPARAAVEQATPVPRSVVELVRHRLTALGRDAPAIIATAAVVGEEFETDTLAEVLAKPADELTSVLDAAAGRGLLVPLTDGDRFRFTHALVLRAASETVGAAQRREVHRRIADVLEARASADPDLRAAIAAHRLAAGARDNQEARAVVAALLHAGTFAMEALAYEDAAERYQRALDACRRWNLEPRVRADALWRLGTAQRATGDPRDAHDTLLEAARLAGAAGEWALVAEAIGDTPYLPSPTTDEHALGILEELRQAAPDDAHAARALVLAKICFARHYSAPVEELVTIAAAAVEAAQASGDLTAIGHAGGAQIRALAGSPDVRERLRLADGAVSNLVNGYSTDAADVLQTRRARMVELARLGEMGRFDEDLHALVELAARVRESEVSYFTTHLQAVRASIAGDLARAEELVGRALALSPGVDSETGYLVLLLMHAFFRGQAGPMADTLGAAASSMPYPMVRCAHAAALAAAGRLTEGAARLDTLAADRYRDVRRDDLWLVSATMLGEACRDLAEAEHAATLYGELEPYAGQFAVVGGALFGVLGVVDRTLGLAAAVAGDVARAEEHLGAAVTLNARAGHRPALALTLADRAWLRSVAGAPDVEIVRAIDDARPLAVELGLDGIVDRLGRLARTADTPTGELHPDGDMWLVGFAGQSITVPPLRGLVYLRHLVANPGRDIRALDLQSSAVGQAIATRPIEPVLDETAKRAFRRRIADIDGEIADAEHDNNFERAARATAERDAIVQELMRATGLGGRDRDLDTESERARLNVSRAIRSAIGRIAAQLPELAHHLDAKVHTGSHCVYRPDVGAPVRWIVD
jgi:tetratricopeptide (TPR) repeat protein